MSTLFVVAIVLIAPIVLPSAAFACTGAERPATAEDVPLMKQAGIGNAVIGMCWNPDDKTVGKADAEAKEYLTSILCKDSKFGGAGADGTIKGLDSKFAICAAKFLRAMSANPQLSGQLPLLNGGSGRVCLREGYRTEAQQKQYANEYTSCKSRGGSNCPLACLKGSACEHPSGRAIDVNTASDSGYRVLWSQAGQYGVNFYLRENDRVHFVPATPDCTGGGQVKPGGGSEQLPPNSYDFPEYYSPPSNNQCILNTSPLVISSGCTGTAPMGPTMPRPMMPPLSMTPSPSPSAAPSPLATNPNGTTPQICTPQFSCSAGIMYYQTSSCTTQVYQVCANGCNGNSCVAATSTSGTVGGAFSTTTVVNNNSNTSTNTNTTTTDPAPTSSVSDLITQLTGYNFKAVDIATSSSIAFSLDPATGDVGHIAPTQQPMNQIVPTTISTIQPTSAPQTFTSSDMSSFGTGYYPAATNTASGLQTILAGMVAALQWGLKVLRSL